MNVATGIDANETVALLQSDPYDVADGGEIKNDESGSVMVGAPYFDNGQTDEGKVFVFYGGPLGGNMDTTADWTAESNQSYAHLGWSVASGSWNGDVYSDVAVGAPDWDENYTSDCGKVFVWYGASGGLTAGSASWSYPGYASGDSFGFSVANARDINSDGYGDLIVGAPNGGDYACGQAYVFNSGSSDLYNGWNWTAISEQAGSKFGYSVAGLGNVNNTYGEDVAIGAPEYDDGQADEGAVFIWHSEATGGLGSYGTPSNVDTYIQINQAGAKFGFTLSPGRGDIDGDGTYFDLAVGAPYYDSGGVNDRGGVFIHRGGSSGVESTSWKTLLGGSAGDLFGYAVAMGQMDNSGADDIVVGMPYQDTWATTDSGYCRVYYGGSSMDTTSDEQFSGSYTGDHFGWSVAGVRRVTYRGYSGFIIGYPGRDGAYTDTGGASVLIYQSGSCP